MALRRRLSSCCSLVLACQALWSCLCMAEGVSSRDPTAILTHELARIGYGKLFDYDLILDHKTDALELRYDVVLIGRGRVGKESMDECFIIQQFPAILYRWSDKAWFKYRMNSDESAKVDEAIRTFLRLNHVSIVTSDPVRLFQTEGATSVRAQTDSVWLIMESSGAFQQTGGATSMIQIMRSSPSVVSDAQISVAEDELSGLIEHGQRFTHVKNWIALEWLLREINSIVTGTFTSEGQNVEEPPRYVRSLFNVFYDPPGREGHPSNVQSAGE